MLSGRPYLIWPHGGDIRLAAGLTPAPRPWRNKLSYWHQRLLLLAAYDNADYIGSHDPSGVGGSIGSVERAIRHTPLLHTPIAITPRQRLRRPKRLELLRGMLMEHDISIPDASHVALVPSRVDFHWKGHDLLFEALSEPEIGNHIHIVVSGWGGDYPRAAEMVQQRGMADRVTFLPFALSKCLLERYFACADFVIDQFTFGTYGTAMVEALAVGCPTMMWIDEEAFAARGWESPPVMNCKGSASILSMLRNIASGVVDLDSVSARSLDWVRRIHAPDVVLPVLVDRLRSAHYARLGAA